MPAEPSSQVFDAARAHSGGASASRLPSHTAVAAIRRLTGAASRRVGRPELLALVDARARQAQHEALGIRAVLASALRGDATYVDVGTNRGQVLREAVRVAPRGRHVAFEPIPDLADEVVRTFPQVDVRQLALGARAEVTQFCHFTQLDGWSGLRRQPEISDARGRPQLITVEVSTLDEQLVDLEPSVIKIDVEGAELAVLEGGRGVLSRTRPVVILEHVGAASALYDATSEAVWDLVTELGYTVFAVSGEGPFTRPAFASSTATVNWLLTPSS